MLAHRNKTECQFSWTENMRRLTLKKDHSISPVFSPLQDHAYKNQIGSGRYWRSRLIKIATPTQLSYLFVWKHYWKMNAWLQHVFNAYFSNTLVTTNIYSETYLNRTYIYYVATSLRVLIIRGCLYVNFLLKTNFHT